MSLTSQKLAGAKVGVEVAQHILWHFGDTNVGVQPGHYVSRLMLLLSAADAENFEKLRGLYPEYAAGFELVARTTWGLDEVRSFIKAQVSADHLDFARIGIEPGHAQVAGDSVRLGAASPYVVTVCRSVNTDTGKQCELPPGHVGLHTASVGRRWA